MNKIDKHDNEMLTETYDQMAKPETQVDRWMRQITSDILVGMKHTTYENVDAQIKELIERLQNVAKQILPRKSRQPMPYGGVTRTGLGFTKD